MQGKVSIPLHFLVLVSGYVCQEFEDKFVLFVILQHIREDLLSYLCGLGVTVLAYLILGLVS